MRRVHPIEAESYRILRGLVDLSHLGPLSRAVAERVIHASADLEYAETLALDESALEGGLRALRHGAPVVTDARMVAAGITARKTLCYVSDPRAGQFSQDLGTTRSAAGFRIAAAEVGDGAVWVVGNAPTALFELLEMDVEPALVVGLPVGFVGAAESKEALVRSGLPAISNQGPKGGSAVAAAAVNALIYAPEVQPRALPEIPPLGRFVLDALRYDTEQMPSVLNLLNDGGEVGWREHWDRDFGRDEVRETLEYLAEHGLVAPYSFDPQEEKLVPIDPERAKDMNDEELWWLLDESGKQALGKWDGRPTAG